MYISIKSVPENYPSAKIYAEGTEKIERAMEIIQEPTAEIVFILNYLGNAWEREHIPLDQYEQIMEVFETAFYDIVEPQIEQILNRTNK